MMATYLVTYACRHFDWWTAKPENGTEVVCATCRANTTVTDSERWS